MKLTNTTEWDAFEIKLSTHKFEKGENYKTTFIPIE